MLVSVNITPSGSDYSASAVFGSALAANGIVYWSINNRRRAYATLASGVTGHTLSIPLKVGDIVSVTLFYQSEFYFSSANIIPVPNVNTALGKSFFQPFISVIDSESNTWKNNVLEKLQIGQFLATYVSRENSADFNAFFGTVLKFFGMYSAFGKILSGFKLYHSLLLHFLQNRNVYAPEYLDISVLQSMAAEFSDVTLNKGSLRQWTFPGIVNTDSQLGHFLRLDFYQVAAFVHHGQFGSGWVIDNHSPLWQGLKPSEVNYADYATVSRTGNFTVSALGSIPVWQLTPDLYLGPAAILKMIPVNHKRNYSFSFFAKGTQNYVASVRCYDGYGNYLSTCTKLINGTSSDDFATVNSFPSSTEYHFRSFGLFAHDTPVTTGAILPSGFHLRMPKGTENIILFLRPASGVLSVHSVCFRPFSLPYSKGFVQSANLVSSWLPTTSKNEIPQTLSVLRERFFPYHYYVKTAQVNNESVTDVFPCLGVQNPDFQLTGKTRCQIVNGVYTGYLEKEYSDINVCTKQASYWQVDSVTSELCPVCPPSGTQTFFFETKNVSPYFTNSGNNYRTRKTIKTTNGSCGFTTSYEYSDQTVINPNAESTEPLWEDDDTPIYCDQSPVCNVTFTADMEDVEVTIGPCEVKIYGHVSFQQTSEENLPSISMADVVIV